MTATTRKFNPGFLTEDELVASFCVRTHEFESIVETLRGCTGSANQHQIVIGPRGSGKTTLLLRVGAEIGRAADLSDGFLPIRFPEESYGVSTAGEFWLESLCQLVHQTRRDADGPDLHRGLQELRAVTDDQLLADRCLALLLDYSDQHRRRLVLLVENLNMMFDEMMDPDAGWRLRHTLQNEPRIVLIGSATSRFEELASHSSALYEQLREYHLDPLNTAECLSLWETLSGESTSEERVRPLEILTGGSPRLLAILARFGAGRSLANLMDQLLDLIDDNTEYFKSHIEFLPAQERRVYLALAELWKPATTSEVAERARLPTNKCSAQLKRLTDRGAVRIAGGTAARKQFYLTERLHNIYYLLRRHRGPEPLVRALLQFMAHYYSPLDLAAMTALFVRDAIAQELTPGPASRLKDALLEQLPILADLNQGLAPPDAYRALQFTTSLGRAIRHIRAGRFTKALKLSDALRLQLRNDEAAKATPDLALTLGLRAALLARLEQPEEAIRSCDEALREAADLSPDLMASFVANTLLMKAELLAETGHLELALEGYVELGGNLDKLDDLAAEATSLRALFGKVEVLERMRLLEQALEACNEIVTRFGSQDGGKTAVQVADTCMARARVLHQLGKPEDALSAIRDAERRYSDLKLPADSHAAITFFAKGATLGTLGRTSEARAAYHDLLRQLAAKKSEAAATWRTGAHLELACLELDCGNMQAASELADYVLERDPSNVVGYERAFLIRAQARLVDDPAGAEEDLAAALAGLPTLGHLPEPTLDTLLAAAAELGVGRVLSLIDKSPSADLLLPLKTALEYEAGLQPRVAREVEEVAKDIRRDLEELRSKPGSETRSAAPEPPS